MRDFVTPPRSGGRNQRKHPSFRSWRTAELISNRWFVHRVLPPSSMSIVYFCFDTKLGQPMVVKSLPSKYLPDTAAQWRFIAECETWIRLVHHQNIVRAYFVEVINDYPYVFVEWVSGKDVYNAGLDVWIGTPNLSFERVVSIAKQVCDGMSHAIEVLSKGNEVFVHRDLKPSNILITGDWIAKITDFGIAKARLLNNSSSGLETHSQSTDSQKGHSQFLGTPPYMSPEHFAGLHFVDSRSDIYSLGCIIFEMITGQQIFDADSWDAWQQAHMYQQAPRLRDTSSVPKYIDELVASCLAKDPAARPQSFREVKERLSSGKS